MVNHAPGFDQGSNHKLHGMGVHSGATTAANSKHPSESGDGLTMKEKEEQNRMKLLKKKTKNSDYIDES